MLAVASSTRIILLFFKNARHMQSNCFSPTERFSFVTFESRPPLVSTSSAKLHYFITWLISASLYRQAGSRLSLKVPFINVGSCSIMVMHDLKSFTLYYLIYLSSMSILPSAGSKMRKRQLINVDFPAPVLPTSPTLCPFSIFKLTLLITKGRPSL